MPLIRNLQNSTRIWGSVTRSNHNGSRFIHGLYPCKGKIKLDAAGVSRSSLDKFWARQPIEHENFVAICTAVGIDWQKVVEQEDRDAANPQQPGSNKLDKKISKIW